MSETQGHEQAGVRGPPAVVVHGKWLIDGTGRRPVRDGSVVIVGGRIEAVGLRREVTVPSGARVIEMPEHTLVPGMVDAHNHVSLHTLYEELPQTTRSEAEVALWGDALAAEGLGVGGHHDAHARASASSSTRPSSGCQAAGVIEAPRHADRRPPHRVLARSGVGQRGGGERGRRHPPLGAGRGPLRARTGSSTTRRRTAELRTPRCRCTRKPRSRCCSRRRGWSAVRWPPTATAASRPTGRSSWESRASSTACSSTSGTSPRWERRASSWCRPPASSCSYPTRARAPRW